MAKILLTGMTAPQASPSADERSRSYAGILFQVLQEAGHEIIWGEPRLAWRKSTFDDYDSILVGIAPITGLGANRAYGALGAIGLFLGDPRLTFFIDAPMPSQIAASLRSVYKAPDSLVKPFYSYRKEFEDASTHYYDFLWTTVLRLLDEQWPTVLYPALPWNDNDLDSVLPLGAKGKTLGTNFDTLLGLNSAETVTLNREETWATDNPKSKWVTSIEPLLNNPIIPMKRNKNTTDSEVVYLLSQVSGALIAPQRNGETWWTPRYAQALSTLTPVASMWQDTSRIGESWGHLTTQIEAMSPSERFALAIQQREAYLHHIPAPEEALGNLENALGI